MSVTAKALSVYSPTQDQPLIQSHYGSLYNVILLHLFSFLNVKDLMAASLVNKHWNKWAEFESTVLGKVKRAFRILNGQREFIPLPVPDQSYRLVQQGGRFRHFLSKKENEKLIRVHIAAPRAQRLLDLEPRYWVSDTLFVSKVGNNWYSNRINYENMTIVSSNMPAFPVLTEEAPEEISVSKKHHFLKVVIKTATAAHLLKYVIDEKSGPDAFYLGELKDHIVCQLRMRNDTIPPYEEVISIAKIEKEQDQEIVKWSQLRNDTGFVQLAMDGKWLLLTSGSLHSQLHYHFIDVSSGREKYTYASRDLSSLGTLYNRFRRILLEKNICIIYEDSTSQWGAFITTKVLELEAKKSIPLSYRTHQDLLSILSKGVFKEEKFECDWTQENGFVKIQNDAFDHQDYQLKLSGNPNVRPTSFSPSPSLYVRFVNFMHSIRNKFTRLVIFHPVAYIVIILIFPLLCLLFLYAMLRNLKK